MGSGARDRRPRGDAVEVETGGRSGSFDGNRSDSLVSWLFVTDDHLHEDDLLQLLNWTTRGHLAWAIFPVSIK